MGARYLLVEFDDETSANRLRAQIDKASTAGKPFRVVGLFAKPTKYCECDPKHWTTTRQSESKLKRGQKFGWYICTRCKRPAPIISGLKNLLSPRDIINAPRHLAGRMIFHFLSISAVDRYPE